MKKQTEKAVENIFKINLKIKKGERVLVFTDNHDNKLKKTARLISKVGSSLLNKINYKEYRTTKNHGAEPPETLWIEAFGEKTVKELKQKKLLNSLITKNLSKKEVKDIEKTVKRFKQDAVNAVIALSYYSTTHTMFRDLLTRICGARYASMPLFDKTMLEGAMRVDWKEMLKRTKNIARQVNTSERIEIRTPNGTFLTFSKKGREARTDTGIITKPGELSNLPAGEVFVAPIEGTANGVLVLEWAPTRKLRSPVTLYIKNGRVSAVEGRERYVKELRKKLSERPENGNIAEFGIGTNDKASRPDNILESEKIFGTIHIALGDNSSFGGKVRAPFHQDFVFFKPTVTLILKDRSRETLLKDGQLINNKSLKKSFFT